MAEATKTPKATPADERLFTVPLRKSWLKVPKNRRAKRSVNTIRSFLSRHMKAPEADIRISSKLNDTIWIRGAAKPPGKVRIKASFEPEAGLLFAGLPDEAPPAADKGKKSEKPSEAESKEGILEKVKEAAEKATSKEDVKKAVDKAVAEKKAAESKAKPEDQEPKKAEKPEPAKKKPAEAKKPAKKPEGKNK
jgi:large subunit ribosomal protein L31e